MKVLAIDCASSVCAACVFDTSIKAELGRAVIDPGKGHAEHLMDVIADAMDAGGVSLAEIDRIAVSVGPGSFTGVRVAVAAARGLSLALQIPAVGVGTLEAVAVQTRAAVGPRTVMVAMDAGRGEFHTAVFDREGQELIAPSALDFSGAIATALRHHPVLSGTAAREIAAKASPGSLDVGVEAATADIACYARLGAEREATAKPRPIYLREPDAKPQMGPVSIQSRK